jgi:hypothetical protein
MEGPATEPGGKKKAKAAAPAASGPAPATSLQ